MNPEELASAIYQELQDQARAGDEFFGTHGYVEASSLNGAVIDGRFDLIGLADKIIKLVEEPK